MQLVLGNWANFQLHVSHATENQLHKTIAKWQISSNDSFGCLPTSSDLITSHRTTSCGRNDLCPIGLSSLLIIHLSNIEFQYRVFVSPTYSSPFLRLFFICLSITCRFASKSNSHCKLRVTIQFILFHNSSSSKSIDCFIVLTMPIA
jgi:hypothetical protein